MVCKWSYTHFKVTQLNTYFKCCITQFGFISYFFRIFLKMSELDKQIDKINDFN